MRYQPVTTCLNCGEPSVAKNRYCKTHLNERRREQAKARKEKLRAKKVFYKATETFNERIMISGKRIKKFFKDNYDPNNIITREVLTPNYVRR